MLFLAEVALVIAVFALADPIKTKLSELLQEEAIRDYRDDINRNNIIDWFQETVSTHCGLASLPLVIVIKTIERLPSAIPIEYQSIWDMLLTTS